MRRRRQLPPKLAEPPPGYMLFYREVRPIKDVERHARRIMRGFDDLPRAQRDRENYWEPKQRMPQGKLKFGRPV
jgi:hypothetical protein